MLLWSHIVALAVIVAAVTAGSMAVGPQPDVPTQQRQLPLVMPALFTVVALWQMAAGVGLYWECPVSSGSRKASSCAVRSLGAQPDSKTRVARDGWNVEPRQNDPRVLLLRVSACDIWSERERAAW
jgi:hypothetical protein